MAAFTVIDHTELSGTTTSWSKASIPATYDHLLLVASVRGAGAGTSTAVNTNLGNGSVDTGANYSSTYLMAASATPLSGRFTSDTEIFGAYAPEASVTADTFATIKIWVPNYANTANFKQVLLSCAMENASTGTATWRRIQSAGLWQSTSAVTDLQLSEPASGFVQYSTFTLYGVTGA